MKKIILVILITLILSLLVYTGIYFIQNKTMKNSFIKFYGLEKYTEKSKPYSFQGCNLNIFNPEFAYLTGRTRILIVFYKPKSLFNPSEVEWKKSYIGSTEVKNTTFPQLLKMVKEDCEQFKKSKGERTDKTINWSYGKYKSLKEKTPEELEKEKKEEGEIERKIKNGEMKSPASFKDEEFIPIEE